MADVMIGGLETTPKLNFHQHFRQEIQTLQSEIASLDDVNLTQGERKNHADAILTRLTRLTAELADASGDLPSYDQRSYNQALKDIQDKLAVAQASYAPRPKFSFKSKRLAAASSEVNSATTTRSATPTYLKEPDFGLVGLEPTPALAAPSLLPPFVQGDTLERFGAQNEPVRATADRLRHKYVCPAQTSPEESHYLQVVSDLETSIVNLDEISSALPTLTLNNIRSSLVIAPDVRGPTHITGLQGITLVLSCQQFRMHNSHNVDVYLFCSSRPIIEDCSGIRFTQLPDVFAGHVERGSNMYNQVDDFKWLRSEASPNWKLLKDDESVDVATWLEIKQALQDSNVTSQERNQGENIQRILSMIHKLY